MVAARAAVDRCGPGHVVAPLLTRTEEGQGRGGVRGEVHGQVPGAHERVQRHIVEQLVEPVREVPVLDAPVPQMVDQLSGFLKDDVVQVIDVPKIRLDSTPLRRPLSEPQMVEQLVEVPMPVPVLVARAGGIFWCMGRTTCTRRSERPLGFTASPGRDIKTGQG